MSKKLAVWALALSLSFGGITASIMAADGANQPEPAKTEMVAKASGERSKGKTCHVRKKKRAGKAVLIEEKEVIPTERAPDAKTPEAR